MDVTKRQMMPERYVQSGYDGLLKTFINLFQFIAYYDKSKTSIFC